MNRWKLNKLIDWLVFLLLIFIVVKLLVLPLRSDKYKHGTKIKYIEDILKEVKKHDTPTPLFIWALENEAIDPEKTFYMIKIYLIDHQIKDLELDRVEVLDSISFELYFKDANYKKKHRKDVAEPIIKATYKGGDDLYSYTNLFLTGGDYCPIADKNFDKVLDREDLKIAYERASEKSEP